VQAVSRALVVDVARHRATGVLERLLIVAVAVAVGATVLRLSGFDAHPSAVVESGDIVVRAPKDLPRPDRIAHDALRATTIWMTIALVAFGLGAILTAGERSAGTLARSLLVQPRRHVFVLHKAASAVVLSAGVALAVGAGSWLLAGSWLASLDASTGTSTVARLGDLCAGVVAVASFAGVGVAVGLVAPSPYAAGAAALVVMVGESALASRAPDVATYLPGHLLEAVSHSGVSIWSSPGVGQGTGVLLLVAWAIAAIVVAGTVFAGRDVP
jgi:hypothetical protein